MKPSTLTPSPASTRGFIVQHTDSRRGRTYHHHGIIGDKVPVYLEDASGVVSATGTLISREHLRIIGFID